MVLMVQQHAKAVVDEGYVPDPSDPCWDACTMQEIHENY